MSVARGRSQIDMSEQNLNDANIDPAFQKMDCKQVPESVDSDRFGNSGAAAGGRAGRLETWGSSR